MDKNIINPIAVAMLLLALLPGIGIATNIKNKSVNTNLQLSRPKHRSIISLMLIVTLSASVLMSVVPFEARAAGGAYTLKWYAADPTVNHAPYLPTYQKLIPARGDILPLPSGTVGRQADPLQNAVAYASPFSSKNLDAVPSLAPQDMALGQVVPFEMEIKVKGNTAPENGAINITTGFLTKTTSGNDFGYDPAYMVYCAFVDTADPGTIDPGQNAKVDSFTYTLANPGTSNEEIQGTFNISGLDNGDNVIVEIWVVLKDQIPASVSGNVQTEVINAETANNDAISTGQQTVPLLQVKEFFTNKVDVSVIKYDEPDPVNLGQYLNYSLVVTNNDPLIVANGIVVTDTLDANTSFVSASGIPESDIFYYSGNHTVIFNVGALSPTQSVTLTINTTVNPTAPTNNDTSENPEAGSATPLTILYDLLNYVSVTAITEDPTPGNNIYYQPTNVLGNPAISIKKSTNGDDANSAPGPYIPIGQTVTWTYDVTNTGNVDLTNVEVTDDKLGAVGTIDSLLVGETKTLTMTGTAAPGQYENIGTATVSYAGNTITATDPSHYYGQGPTGQICPTQTTCDQYMSGIAADLTQANYLVNSKTNAIKSVSPGVMFYYSTIEISAAGSVDISVAQSNNDTWPAIAIQDAKQVILYDSTCSKIAGTNVTTIDKGSTVNLHADNLQPGTYYLGIKYSLSDLQGYKLITQTYPTVKYTFETMLNGNVISTSKDSIDLVPKK
jgi:uncharacterized repeat protein (TIGR01451 family)